VGVRGFATAMTASHRAECGSGETESKRKVADRNPAADQLLVWSAAGAPCGGLAA
jgi:hypothetical protein